MVDTVRWQQANPGSSLPPLIYRVITFPRQQPRHDGARPQPSRNVLDLFFQRHPQVVHDLHESIPFLYISTVTVHTTRGLIRWQSMNGTDGVQRSTDAYRKGPSLCLERTGLRRLAPNYMFWAAHGHNAIGRFFTRHLATASPRLRTASFRDASQRQWFRPNPPLPQVKWSLRNNVNFQQSGILLALNYMAENHEHFLKPSAAGQKSRCKSDDRRTRRLRFSGRSKTPRTTARSPEPASPPW